MVQSCNFLQVGESIDEKFEDTIGEDTISAYFGRSTGKLYGFKIVSKDGKGRRIWLSDIDRMNEIIKEMKGED